MNWNPLQQGPYDRDGGWRQEGPGRTAEVAVVQYKACDDNGIMGIVWTVMMFGFHAVKFLQTICLSANISSRSIVSNGLFTP